MSDVEMLLGGDIQAQLAAMATDPDIQQEIQAIEAEFSIIELDGLDPLVICRISG